MVRSIDLCYLNRLPPTLTGRRAGGPRSALQDEDAGHHRPRGCATGMTGFNILLVVLKSQQICKGNNPDAKCSKNGSFIKIFLRRRREL